MESIMNSLTLRSLTRKVLRILSDPAQPSAYRVEHLLKAGKYVKDVASSFSSILPTDAVSKLYLAGISHDIVKTEMDADRVLGGYTVPGNLNRYVRLNLNELEPYGLADYFNTDMQLHAIASGIFMIREMKVTDPEILYPIFFHSCPIMEVYLTLSDRIRLMVDIMQLADKLSSGSLKGESGTSRHSIDIDTALWGESGCEFNFQSALLLARLIAQDKSKEKHSLEATEYYWKRLVGSNPLFGKLELTSLKGIIREMRKNDHGEEKDTTEEVTDTGDDSESLEGND